VDRVSGVPCLIVTLCKSPNFGAYLQAFALQKILTAYGYQVSFLDIYDSENNKKKYRLLFRGWKRTPLSVIFNIRKLLAFKQAERKLRFAARYDLSEYEVAFIGSDEIWSVTNGTFNSAPEFFGLDLPNIKKFAYAPSVGNSSLEDLKRYPHFIQGLTQLDMLSVRDYESLQVAVKLAQRDDAAITLDPTFLYNFEADEEKLTKKKPYLLVYTYGFNREIIEEVKSYARKNGLRIISVGFYHTWVDENISCGPFQFLSAIKDAEYVVTDTFHGSIFAIKYRKNFLSYGKHKNKVAHLLNSLGLSDNLVDAGFLSGDQMIETDYSDIDPRLDSLINNSRKYLERCNAWVIV